MLRHWNPQWLIVMGASIRGARQIWVKEIPPHCPYPPLPALKDRLVRFKDALRDVLSISVLEVCRGPPKHTYPALRPRTVPPIVPYPMLNPSSKPPGDDIVI